MSDTAASHEQKDVLPLLRKHVEDGDSEIVSEGRLLTERELSETLGVGRRAIRKALEVLEAEGAIVRQQGHGTFVRGAGKGLPSLASLSVITSPAEILEVRRGLEPLLARMAALRATPTMIAELRKLVKRGLNAKSGREYEKWDAQFHTHIVRCTNNQLYLAIFDMIASVRSEQGWSTLRNNTYSTLVRDQLGDQHDKLVEAIAARDPDEAEQRMRDHLQSVANLFGV